MDRFWLPSRGFNTEDTPPQSELSVADRPTGSTADRLER